MTSTKLTGELERRCAAGVQVAAAELAAPDPEGICATFGEWRGQTRRRPWTWLPGLCYEALAPLDVAFPENDEAVVIAGRVLIGVESDAGDVRRVWPRWQTASNETGELELAKGAPSQLHRRSLLSAVDTFWGRLAESSRAVGQAVAAGERDQADQLIRDSKRQLAEIAERLEITVERLVEAEREEAEQEAQAQDVGDDLDVWPIAIVEPGQEGDAPGDLQSDAPEEDAYYDAGAEHDHAGGQEDDGFMSLDPPATDTEPADGEAAFGVFDAERYLHAPLPDEPRQEVLWAPAHPPELEPELELDPEDASAGGPQPAPAGGPEPADDFDDAFDEEELLHDDQVVGDEPPVEPELEATQAMAAQTGDDVPHAAPEADETTLLDQVPADETVALDQVPEAPAEPERDKMWDLDELPAPGEYAELEQLNGRPQGADASDVDAPGDDAPEAEPAQADDEAVAVEPEEAAAVGKHAARPAQSPTVDDEAEAWSVADLAGDDDLDELSWDDDDFDPVALADRTEELQQAADNGAPDDESVPELAAEESEEADDTGELGEVSELDETGEEEDAGELEDLDEFGDVDELEDIDADAAGASESRETRKGPLRDEQGRIIPSRKARRMAAASAAVEAAEPTGELPELDDAPPPEPEPDVTDEQPLAGAGAATMAARTEAQNNTSILIFLGATTLGALLWFMLLATGLIG